MLDILEIEIAPPHRVRVMTTMASEKEAQAFIDIAVIRRGVENHFFTTRPAGRFKDGDYLLSSAKPADQDAPG